MKRVYALAGVLFAVAGGAVYLWGKAVRDNKTIGEVTLDAASRAAQFLTRGLRNNNPGNIRISSAPWQGKIALNTDGSFEQFDTPENGIRAIAKVLQSYHARGINTIESIIRTWAPPSENNTEAYIASVANSTGLGRSRMLVYPVDLYAIVSAIIKHENGFNPYTPDVIAAGIARA